MSRIRLLLVEDHHVVREGIKALLEYHGGFEIVGCMPSGEEAVNSYQRLSPDVVIMDLQLPGMDGTSAIRAIRAQDADAKVLVLTTYAGDEDIRKAIAAGANGYLLKDCETSDLYEAIEKVAAGGEISVPSVSTSESSLSTLSEREVEVLRNLAQGLSNREIADRLFLSEATVRTHVGHIYAKLDVSDRVEAVVVANRRGIIRI